MNCPELFWESLCQVWRTWRIKDISLLLLEFKQLQLLTSAIENTDQAAFFFLPEVFQKTSCSGLFLNSVGWALLPLQDQHHYTHLAEKHITYVTHFCPHKATQRWLHRTDCSLCSSPWNCYCYLPGISPENEEAGLFISLYQQMI